MSPMIQLLIADDHQVLIEGLKMLLTSHETITVAHTVNNGRAVLEVLKKHPIDVILLDINLPLMNGLEVCKAVKRIYPQVKILALTMLNKGSFVQQMLKNGASGYLLKNVGHQELVEAIQTVHKGGTYINKETSKLLMDSLMNKSNSKDFIPRLTRREKQVLQLIAQELTTAEIAAQLHLSLSTVESHRRNLLTKLNVRNSVGLIKVAMQRGLLE